MMMRAKRIRLLLLGAIYVLASTAQSQWWEAVGAGVDGVNHQVFCFAEYQGELYVGGHFSTAGGNTAIRIAKWNGNSWSSFGATVQGDVRDLEVYNGELYACGDFYYLGGQAVGGIAKWDGISWSAVGNQPFSGGIKCLAVYNNELYAGGLVGLYRWDGTIWSANLGTAPNAMAVHDSDLYVVGDFSVPYNGIAKYDGATWSEVGNSGSGGGVDGFPKAVVSYNGNLYVGGLMFYVDGLPVEGIAMWDGMNWSSVGGGLDNDVAVFLVINDVLYVGGYFSGHIKSWDENTWTMIGQYGLNSWVFALANYEGCLYAGGNFNGYGPGASMFNQVAKYCGWVGMDDHSIQSSCQLYPNPSQGVFRVQLSNCREGFDLELIDLLGETVHHQNVSGPDVEIHVQNVPTGTYFAKITSNGHCSFHKLVIL